MRMFRHMREDIRAILERDPAARNGAEVFFLSPGFRAVTNHRMAHFLYTHHCIFLAKWLAKATRFFTQIEIHPAAKLGRGVMIDHGSGVVVGETTVIGDNCTIYQGVTLGGTGKEKGKRHPTLGDNVLVGSGARVLGPVTIGSDSKVAAGAVVLTDIPPNSTCVGVPARVVRRDNQRVSPCKELDQIHIPDPVAQELCRMQGELDKLREQLEKISQHKGETHSDENL